MNDYAIGRIEWFAQLPEFQIYGFWTEKELEEKSYIRWTTYELLNEIMDHPTTTAIDTLEEMWLRMLAFYHEARSPRARRQFEAALNTLDTIRALL